MMNSNCRCKVGPVMVKWCSGAKSFFMVMGSVSWWLAILSLVVVVVHLIWCNISPRGQYVTRSVTISDGYFCLLLNVTLYHHFFHLSCSPCMTVQVHFDAIPFGSLCLPISPDHHGQSSASPSPAPHLITCTTTSSPAPPPHPPVAAAGMVQCSGRWSLGDRWIQ